MWLAVLLALTAAPPEISEIRLERTPCFGACPIDEVTLRPDGTASYVGKRFVEKLGRYSGTFDRDDFDQLARKLESLSFFDLQDHYTKPISDLPSLITTATRGDQTKQVVDYAQAGPAELREVEKDILKLMEEIHWQKEDVP